jgi:hypothetical protein
VTPRISLRDALTDPYLLGHVFANPDVEVLAAARPGLLTTGGPLIMASSPYAKQGVLWDTYRKHYGPDGAPSVLVAKGTTRDFNQTIVQSEIDRELERDRARNTAELLAEFRSDLESYVSLEAVEACVGSYYEMAPDARTSYYAFTDPSSGSEDSFTLAIAHRERERVVVDCIREVRPPFSPEQVIAEFVPLLRSYRCRRVTGDRYGGEFPREQFRKRGILYDVSERVKSDIYVNFLPMINSTRVMIPRHEKGVRQLCSLERTTTRGSGKENIDHPRGMHDDVANAMAGAAVLAAANVGYNLESLQRAYGDWDDPLVTHAVSQLFPSSAAEQAHDELMARYGGPVPGSLMPREFVEQAKAAPKAK